MKLLPGKLRLALALMISSIALLLVFQYVWLKKVYQEERGLLQKDATVLFKDVVYGLQDSIIQRGIDFSGDTQTPKFTMKLHPPDMPGHPDRVMRSDTVERLVMNDIKESKVQVFITSTDEGDIQTIDRRQLSTVVTHAKQMTDSLHGNFTFTFKDDSLRLDEIRRAYKAALANAGISLPFELFRLTMGDTLAYQPGIATPLFPAGFPPEFVYAANIHPYQAYLYRQVAPQAVFSLILVALTSLSFWFIFRSLRQQQRLTELKNDFISNMTHELKTPIATVSVAIEALRNFNAMQNPQLTREYLDISKNELGRLTLLVDKVLKMAIFEQQALALQCEHLDLKTLVQEVLNSMKLQFEQVHAQVDLREDGESFPVYGDRTHLLSVVYNLVDNALKYSPENPKITLSLMGKGQEVSLAVRDNGIGIAPAYRRRVYERFFRVPSGDVHNIKGHGLGLSYVAEVVQRHSGRIILESEEGAGSCFTVYFPKDGQAD